MNLAEEVRVLREQLAAVESLLDVAALDAEKKQERIEYLEREVERLTPSERFLVTGRRE